MDKSNRYQPTGAAIFTQNGWQAKTESHSIDTGIGLILAALFITLVLIIIGVLIVNPASLSTLAKTLG